MAQQQKAPAVRWAGAKVRKYDSRKAIGNFNSTVAEHLQTATGVATPLRHDAHPRSPANQVDENPKSGLRRSQESEYGTLKKKTPAKADTEAGAACVVSTGNNISRKLDSTFPFSREIFSRCQVDASLQFVSQDHFPAPCQYLA
jgi:hypothetical protein